MMENYSTKLMPDIIKQAANNANSAQNSLNDFCSSIQNQSFFDAKRLHEDIDWYLMLNTNSYNTKGYANFSPYLDLAYVAKQNG